MVLQFSVQCRNSDSEYSCRTRCTEQKNRTRKAGYGSQDTTVKDHLYSMQLQPFWYKAMTLYTTFCVQYGFGVFLISDITMCAMDRRVNEFNSGTDGLQDKNKHRLCRTSGGNRGKTLKLPPYSNAQNTHITQNMFCCIVVSMWKSFRTYMNI